ncbi:Rid family detoxifying hydrolase [Spirulina major CS-329]|uniref:Rid family detoxifying hydrolase n=1 Tax=Spirulina TaxID=1154 RepID=UPI00232D5413|nr:MULTISPECIES: Rid family detoxifying hydrolase [Spirulina]MDB9494097.1 Rid family detoxifying hydrolase [Spirulina subsalsa CS-330]MDB9505166.1 Rid family detoxifying hydrolase [Spirulina major CS-329]
MEKQIIQTDQAPAPVGPYNQAIAATGQFLFVAGQIPLNAAGDLVGGDDVAAQTQQVMQNLAAILAEAGATFEQVVKTTVFLTDLADFTTMNGVYATFFNEASAPARATVQVAQLPKGVKVEIDCIAVL